MGQGRYWGVFQYLNKKRMVARYLGVTVFRGTRYSGGHGIRGDTVFGGTRYSGVLQ